MLSIKCREFGSIVVADGQHLMLTRLGITGELVVVDVVEEIEKAVNIKMSTVVLTPRVSPIYAQGHV